MMKIKNFLSRNFCKTACVCVCLAGLLFVSCADDDLVRPETGENKGALVRFNVIDAQSEAAASASSAYMTRAAFAELLLPQGLTPEDLVHQTLPSVTSDGTEACLVETTVAGVNPVKQDESNQTRANISEKITEKFSTIGYKGKTAEEVENINKEPWFHNNETKANGQLVTPIYWDKEQPFARFYGISPHATFGNEDIKLSDDNYKFTPYVDFKVEKEVEKQKDLMTACSDVVKYNGQGEASAVDLNFRHALTAVRFKVGDNLSYNKTIEKIEIRNAMSEGRYTLASGKKGNNEAWSELKKEATFTLSVLKVSTSKAVNQVIVGNEGDDGVFYMVPQKLENVSVYITFTDKTIVKTKLSGSWEPGTTKTYALSEKNSTWDYVLTSTGSGVIDYNATTSDYGITSYRKDPVTQILQPVAWQVVGYQESSDDGQTWSELSPDKPAWLTSLTKDKGEGGANEEKGTANIRKDVANLLANYNKELSNAPAKGSVGNYYDLSMHDLEGKETLRNTANCYLISAPGYYSFPLVYGNAVKNGQTDEKTFKTNTHGANVLQRFKAHDGRDISYGSIDAQNPDQFVKDAAVLWADQSGIVDNLSINGELVQFHVSKERIRNGNAVIVVKDREGTIMWSWHLWFVHKDALDIVAVKNHQGQTYKFTKESLGFTYTKWQGSTYDKARLVRMKIEQTVANKGVKQTTYVSITQKPGGEKEVASTYYQFGRKDPFPIERYISGAYSVPKKSGAQDISTLIKNPGTFYYVSDSPYSAYKTPYNNLWSMNNSGTGFNDNDVVKTIYDPCPVGFKMPPSNAFTGFTTTGEMPKHQPEWRISGSWNKGWNFRSDVGSGKTLYFPATGYRSYSTGIFSESNEKGRYWSAIPSNNTEACGLSFSETELNPQFTDHRAYGFAVRPIAEK